MMMKINMIDFYFDKEDQGYVLQKEGQRFVGTIDGISKNEIVSLAKKIFKKFDIKTFEDFKKEMEDDRDQYI